jgi:Fic family protein
MRELHERLMKDVRGGKATPGAFRRTPNWIGPPGSNLSSASYVPPPVPEMRECLDALEKYLHAEASHPPLVRLAFIHYQFEAIHPFLDGNGRIGRLLISLLAVHWGLLPLPLLYLSAFFERHREEYYSLLLSVSARGRWSEWVRFFLRGATVEARSALRKAQRLQDLQAEWRSRLTRRRASALLLRLADSLFNAPMLTVPDAQSTLNAAYTTAQRNVDRLVAEGILSPVGGETYGRFFVAEEILRVVDVEDGGGQI